ncbi:MAG TPA: four helix bundle protein [Herpetosiphonaceae bacterium]|nr:four helix bundle protein [Herpetosiphonaceae bacterium]
MQYERKEQPYEDLVHRTKRYALQIIRLCAGLPKTMEAQVLGKQLLRSGTSVGANYREASKARSDSEFLAKLGISLQEIEESAYWLELLGESSIVSTESIATIYDETRQITAILTAIIKKRKGSIREEPALFESRFTQDPNI